MDSYQTGASDYLLKPLEKNRLFQSLDKIIRSMEKEQRSFVTIKTRDGLLRIPLRCVAYGELVGRCVQYHLSDGSVLEGMSLRGSFQDAVRPLLAHRRFALCAASFVVNLSFVEKINSDGLQMAGGEVLPVSRGLRAQVTSRWLDYCLEGRR